MQIKMTIYAFVLAGFFFVSCPVANDLTELPWTFLPGIIEKVEYTNGDLVKAALSIDGKTEDPRLALSYRIGGAAGPYYFDYVILRSAKMVKRDTGSSITFDLDLGEIQSILDGRTTFLVPLQQRGIKVLLYISNSGEGFSFANLPYKLRHPFAKTCKDILVRYNLDGLEFDDINGGPGAYPSQHENYYDPAFDDYPDYNPANIGDRINIASVSIPRDENNPANGETWSMNTDQKEAYFWLQGGYNYGAFLSYFRPLPEWETPDTPPIAVIGTWDDKPILVRESGFGSGNSNLQTILDNEQYTFFGRRNSYIADWVKDKYRPEMQFTAVLDMANVFISPGPVPAFGWEGSGLSIMNKFVTHQRYAPGILDMSSITDAEIEAFSRRFANGNMDNPNDLSFHGDPYKILYYTNVGTGDAERLSITSSIVYGGREEDGVYLVGLLENGPAVVYTGN